jgi:hypothetical protein
MVSETPFRLIGEKHEKNKRGTLLKTKWNKQDKNHGNIETWFKKEK